MNTSHTAHVSAAPPLTRLALLAAACLMGLLASFILLGSVSPLGAIGTPEDKGEVPELADLQIDVQGPDVGRAGHMITYVLLYTNTMPFPLSNVVLTDSLSGKQWYQGTYIATPEIPPGNFTWSGNLAGGWRANWSIGTLAPGAGGQIVLTATVPVTYQPYIGITGVPAVGPNTIGNSGIITTTTAGVTGGQDSVSMLIVGPVLQVTKKGFPTDPRPGNPLTYTIYITNQTVLQRPDTIPATNLVITDVVPANTTFVWADQGGVYSPTKNWVIWQHAGPLNPGAGIALRFKVRLQENLSNGAQIRNQYYCVLSAEILANMPCGVTLTTTSGSLLNKTPLTGPPDPAHNKVWPKELVTYTIQVWNPREIMMTVRLTDTLPGNPQKFIYQYMVSGPAPVITTPQLVWTDLPLAPQTYTELKVVVRVPGPTIITADGGTGYGNGLSAKSSDGFVFPTRTNIAQVVVTPRLVLRKTVVPSHNLDGRPVTYTLELDNVSTSPVYITRVTDTLPVQFTYAGTITGPMPIYQAGNIVAWGGFTVPASQSNFITFVATAHGVPLARLCNAMSALSPDTGIPAKNNQACVTIDPPLLVNKVVAPDEVFVGESTSYDITYQNASTTTYIIDGVTDHLPTGFLWNGLTDYVLNLNPPVSIAPGSSWSTGPFPVSVNKNVGCSNLPRDVSQPAGAVVVHVTSPLAGYYENAGSLAPLYVKPNATIVKTAYHNYVTPGEIFSYTLTIANTSPMSLAGVTITDTLPAGFNFVGMVQGPPPTDPTAPTIVWSNLSLPAGETLVLTFNVQAALTTGTYRNSVTASTTSNGCIKGVTNVATVYVVGNVVLATKTVVGNVTTVPPAGTIEYQIKLENRDQLPLTALVVTDTLPEEFVFLAMTQGPTATLIPPRTLVWHNITLPPNAVDYILKFRVQSSILFGTYTNQVDGVLTRGGPLGPATVNVTVVPGIAVYKTVYPTQVYYGGGVVYTITVLNRSSVAVSNVTITDTLESNFFYGGMLTGPDPSLIAGRTVAWTGLSVPVNGRVDLAFRVTVFPGYPGIYWNNVVGSSPTVEIPDPGNTAPLLTLPSFWDMIPFFAYNGSP